MRRIFPWLALLLATLWLPMTGHCSLESAGILSSKAANPCTCHGQTGCTDGCSTVEDGNYRSSAEVVKVPRPAVIVSDFLFCFQFVLPFAEEVGTFSGGTFDRSSDWVSTWHFVRRAAPPARAPSAVLT